MNKYEELESVGKGQFGIIKKVRRISDGRLFASKQVAYGIMSQAQKSQLVNEVNILKELNHEHIVKYYQHFLEKKNSNLYIIMEYCPGGDLASVLADIKQKGEFLDEDMIWKLFFQIISALHYCHQRKIIHRDLKPANIFIDESWSNIKIGDFGLSRELGEHSIYAETHVGTPLFMSPEIMLNQKYNDRIDIWALGCILYELAALKHPFKAHNMVELGDKIQKANYDPLPSRYSCHLRTIISKMLSRDWEDRPSAADILKIPYLSIRQEDKEYKQKYEELKRKE